MEKKHYTGAETIRAMTAILQEMQARVQAEEYGTRDMRAFADGICTWFLRMGLIRGAAKNESEILSLMERRMAQQLSPRPEILAAYQAGRPCYAKCRMSGKTSWGYRYLPLTELDENTSSGYARFAMAQMTDGSSPEKLETNYVKIGADGTAVGYFGTQDLGSAQMLPEVDPSDEGKFLRVNWNAEWVAEAVPSANGGSF